MEKNQNSGMSRREFLKTSALLGAMLSVAPLAGACVSKTGAVPVPEKNDPAGRTLGRGAAAFRVSSLGFGCMGLCYNRSWQTERLFTETMVTRSSSFRRTPAHIR